MTETTQELTTRTVPVTVRVVRDEDAENPRTTFDHIGLFAGWHKRYVVGDIQPKDEPLDWLKENAPEGSVVLAVYMLDHGVVRYSTGSFNDPWDSGQVGFIVATPEKIRTDYNVKRISARIREEVAKRLKSEVQEYDDWANGNVWGFEVAGGGFDDSCYGFYGDESTLEAMQSHVPKQLHEAMEEAWENRFDQLPDVTVLIEPADEERKRLEAEDKIREKARAVIAEHLPSWEHVEIEPDATVTVEDDGAAWVTARVRVDKDN